MPKKPLNGPLAQELELGNQNLTNRTGQHSAPVPGELIEDALAGDNEGALLIKRFHTVFDTVV